MIVIPRARHLIQLALILLTYYVVGRLGLHLSFRLPGAAAAVWPAAGVALAAFLLFGRQIWPAIFLAALLLGVAAEGSLFTSLGIAAGATLEGLAGAWLATRFAGGRRALERTRDFFAFAIVAVLGSAMLGATAGTFSVILGGFAGWSDAAPVWLSWWLGNAVGDLVVAPVVLTWSAGPGKGWHLTRFLEAAALLVGLVTAGLIAFGGLIPYVAADLPLDFLLLPFLVWAAFRFGPRESATAILILAVMASWGTLRGLGPFVWVTPHQSLLLLQVYLGVAAVTTLALAAVVFERDDMVARLRHLAVSDPLTGLANYRSLIDRMQAETERSRRSRRPFAVLFLDVDHLKQINDRHGHLTGSRALCRVGGVLQIASRTIDTAARYGGDEFALLLPEADRAAAEQVGARVTELLSRDGEGPPITVSLGVAVYPEDGRTPEALLATADQALYRMKRREG